MKTLNELRKQNEERLNNNSNRDVVIVLGVVSVLLVSMVIAIVSGNSDLAIAINNIK